MAQFKGMKAASNKKTMEEDMSGLELSDAKKKEKAAKAEKARKEKLTLEAGFRVADEQPRYEREDRGAGRNGRGRGRGRGGDRPAGDRPAGGRGGRTGPAPNVMDESAFPTLG
mmetsp:Transcript_40853/g.103503  ORF Transcript_40853/g.103503 Transcript_40853/m.103503 type:complete len:113 (+) Transcript_40853:1102-1440(+)